MKHANDIDIARYLDEVGDTVIPIQQNAYVCR